MYGSCPWSEGESKTKAKAEVEAEKFIVTGAHPEMAISGFPRSTISGQQKTLKIRLLS
jgi:hypothetical protein